MLIFYYIIYFLYPLWYLGYLSTDNGLIFGFLFIVHSAYSGLFTVIAWFFDEPYSFIVNILLIALCLYIYNWQ